MSGDVKGIGQLFKSIMDPPQHDGPPYIHTIRPPETIYEEELPGRIRRALRTAITIARGGQNEH